MTKHPGPANPWEYKLVSMGNPLEPDVESRANALGRQSWELVTVDAGVWIFKRPLSETADQPLQALMEATVPIAEQEAPLTTPGSRPG